MNIILGSENLQQISDKYTVLELDTFVVQSGKSVTAYCVLENVMLVDYLQIDNLCDLHANLMKNYKIKNWNFCEQALEHLRGRWNGQLDSFYLELAQRINDLKQADLPTTWKGELIK